MQTADTLILALFLHYIIEKKKGCEVMQRVRERFSQLAEDYNEDTVKIRRYLHQHPEISGNEKKTTNYIHKQLMKNSIDTITEPFQTGLVARVKGAGRGKNICIRVGIDALPVKETSKFPFAAKNENACHCCGHDLQVAAAITCARILQETKDSWHGSVGFIFQPSVETGEGAKYMIAHQALEFLQPDVMLGFHCWPEMKAGSVGVRPGPMMAAVDFIKIRIEGKSGPAAHPHKCVDPILIASYVVQQLQHIVSRECSPTESAVITIGKIVGGTSDNSVAAAVEMEGSVHTLLEKDRIYMQKAICRIVQNTSAAMGGSGRVTVLKGVDPLLCDETISAYVEEAAACVAMGPIDQLQKPSMEMEDFAYYLRDIPGAYFRVGTANELASSKLPLHNPSILFDERAISVACKVLLQFTALYST